MRFLCRLDELQDNESRGFALSGSDLHEIFLVRRAGAVYGYRNSCPHRGTSLDWLPHRFLDPERRYIQCATHDARFEVEDGLCVAGPCVGRHLQPVALHVHEGEIFLLDPS